MTKYITNFCKDAIDHWEDYQAVREIFQNYKDSDGEQELELGEDYIILTNKNIKVSPQSLLTGKSDKRDDASKRGKFGTGSNFALCIFASRGIDIRIHNNDVIWTPVFEWSEQYQDEVMVINETPAPFNNYSYSVSISGLSEEALEDVRQTTLDLQTREVLYSTKYGDVIESVDDNGEVYVGGIFVQQTNGFNYSYDIKPEFLKLDQDRKSCSEWDLQTLTAKLIMATGDKEFIKEAIDVNKLDTHHVTYSWTDGNVPDEVEDEYAQDFVDEHGEGVLVTSDYLEHQQNEDLGNESVYIPNTVQVQSIHNSSIYQEAIEDMELVEKKEPHEEVETMKEYIMEFLYTKITSEEICKIEELIDDVVDKSQNWRE